MEAVKKQQQCMSDNHFPPRPIPLFPTLKDKKYFTYPVIQHKRQKWNNALNEEIIDKVIKHLELFAFYQMGFSYQSYGGSEMLQSVTFYMQHNSGNDAK